MGKSTEKEAGGSEGKKEKLKRGEEKGREEERTEIGMRGSSIRDWTVSNLASSHEILKEQSSQESLHFLTQISSH